jgi:hypothetical protein
MKWSKVARLWRREQEEPIAPAPAQGSSPYAAEMWACVREAAVLRLKAKMMPSSERRADMLREAERLMERGRDLSDADESSREYAERVRRCPGGVHFPDRDGPL